MECTDRIWDQEMTGMLISLQLSLNMVMLILIRVMAIEDKAMKIVIQKNTMVLNQVITIPEEEMRDLREDKEIIMAEMMAMVILKGKLMAQIMMLIATIANEEEITIATDVMVDTVMIGIGWIVTETVIEETWGVLTMMTIVAKEEWIEKETGAEEEVTINTHVQIP
jgi:hypothetical protein